MDLRRVLASPPAVAGLALLVVVALAALVTQLRLNASGGDTEVAGVVIERSEPPVVETEAPRRVVEPPILRPDRPPADVDVTEDEPAEPVVQQPPPPPPAPTGGLVREPAPQDTADDPDRAPRPDRDRNREPKPRDEPTQAPEPEPEPTEDDTSRFALREGTGHSRDTAIADNGDWLFLQAGGHAQQSESSRAPQARLTVGFSDAALQGQGPTRDLACHAVLTAGSRRLVTDRDHVFTVALWTADEQGVPQQEVHAVLLKRALDLAAGEQQTLSMDSIVLDAADGVHYTCVVTYEAL